MAGRGYKGKHATNELSQDLVPEASRSRSSSGSIASNDSVDRLANIMANFLQNAKSPSVGTAKGDVVPEFYPEKREQSSEIWLNKVDELREVFNWSESTTIYFALSKLKGLAEVWYKGLQTMKYTWAEWKVKILAAFPSARDYHEVLSEMMRRKKMPHETYQKYFYEKLSLLNQCNITGKDAVSCILGDIDDTVVKAAAKAGNYCTPEDLFHYLNTLHDLRPVSNGPKAKFVQRPNGRNRPSRTENYQKDKLKCFGCGKMGHAIRDCELQRNRCNYCRKLGHLENNCYLKNKEKAKSGEKRAVL